MNHHSSKSWLRHCLKHADNYRHMSKGIMRTIVHRCMVKITVFADLQKMWIILFQEFEN